MELYGAGGVTHFDEVLNGLATRSICDRVKKGAARRARVDERYEAAGLLET